MTYKPLLSLCIILILMSCGSKRLVSETSGTTDLATANVIKKHYENAVSFETLAGRLKSAEKGFNVWKKIKPYG